MRIQVNTKGEVELLGDSRDSSSNRIITDNAESARLNPTEELVVVTKKNGQVELWKVDGLFIRVITDNASGAWFYDKDIIGIGRGNDPVEYRNLDGKLLKARRYRIEVQCDRAWRESVMGVSPLAIEFNDDMEAYPEEEVEDLNHYYNICNQTFGLEDERYEWVSRDDMYLCVYDDTDELIYKQEGGYNITINNIMDDSWSNAPGTYIFRRDDIDGLRVLGGFILFDDEEFDPSKLSVENLYRVKTVDEDSCWFDEEFLEGQESPLYIYGLCYNGMSCGMQEDDYDDITTGLNCLLTVYTPGYGRLFSYEECECSPFCGLSDDYESANPELFDPGELIDLVENGGDVPERISTTSVEISDDETTIESERYLNYISLKEVIIPESIKTIEEGVFSGCISLEKIIIPDSVEDMYDSVFCDCISLKDVQLSNKLEYISEKAFYCCSSLKRIIIPKSVNEIGPYAFEGCTSLEEIWIQNESCECDEFVNIPENVKIYRGLDRPSSFELDSTSKKDASRGVKKGEKGAFIKNLSEDGKEIIGNVKQFFEQVGDHVDDIVDQVQDVYKSCGDKIQQAKQERLQEKEPEGQLDRLERQLDRLERQQERLDRQQKRLDRQQEKLDRQQERLDRQQERLEKMKAAMERGTSTNEKE